MIYILLVVVFAEVNRDFFEFAEKYQNQGYTWEYVGKQPAEPGYPHLEVYDSENNPVYYFQLFEPKKKAIE